MNEKNILFFSDDVDYVIREKTRIRAWINQTIKDRKKKPGSVNVILCSDKALRKINAKYLGKTDYTDTITFDFSESGVVSGDIYISIDRIRENARTYRVSTRRELLRVIIHGVLHLCGYADKTKTERQTMINQEDKLLKTWDEM